MSASKIWRQWSGQTDSAAPIVVLAHSLGTDHTLWDPQVASLRDRYRILLFDFPGHGRSAALPIPGSIERLGSLIIDLLEEEQVETCHFVGLSLGGMLGQWLGATAPERLDRLVLANTAARIENRELLQRRIEALRRARPADLSGLETDILAAWFTTAFCSSNPETVEACRTMLSRVSPGAYADTAALVCETDLRELLPQIAAPTLVITGASDTATPPAWGQAIAANVPRSEFREFPSAHLSNREATVAFNQAMTDFIAR